MKGQGKVSQKKMILCITFWGHLGTGKDVFRQRSFAFSSYAFTWRNHDITPCHSTKCELLLPSAISFLHNHICKLISIMEQITQAPSRMKDCGSLPSLLSNMAKVMRILLKCIIASHVSWLWQNLHYVPWITTHLNIATYGFTDVIMVQPLQLYMILFYL